nr:uncharacterized protein LOC112005609 [Quercus suber]
MVESATTSANPPEIERRGLEETEQAKLSKDCLLMGTLLQIPLAMLGVCGCFGRRRVLKCLIFQAQNRKFMLLLRSLIARLVQVRVVHVYREVNQCANLLAKRVVL